MKNKKENKFFVNPKRLVYLLDLYKLSERGFIELFNEGRARDIMTAEIFKMIIEKKEGIGVNWLKRIDKIFNKGLTWVVSGTDAPNREKSSVFFSKDKFNADLTLSSKKKISEYENLKSHIQILSNYIDFDLSDKFRKKFTIKHNAEMVADEVWGDIRSVERTLIANKTIKRPGDDRSFLENLIRIFEEFNIFTFEFTETYNQKDKASFDGFFISPNIIVVKRQQKYFRREIFTLMHEFAHYLLNVEEVDDDDDDKLFVGINSVEKWCHSFAYYFLLGEQKEVFKNLSHASENNNYYSEEIENIYKKTKLSFKAIYTNLLIAKKIDQANYDRLMDEIDANIKAGELKRKMENDMKKASGIDVFAMAPQPIVSNIFKTLVVSNYFEGNINEPELRSFLKVGQKQAIEDVIY